MSLYDNTNHVDINRRQFVKGTLAGIGALAIVGVVGCGKKDPDANYDPSAPKESWTFVDQNGYETTVQYPCDRLVVLQHHSLDILCQLGAQKRIVGVVDSWKTNLGDYMNTVFPGIADLPMPGGLNSWNVESIAALNPDCVIAAAQAPKDAVEQVKKLGIPVVTVQLRGEGKQAEAQNPRLSNADAAYTEGCEWGIKTLGKLTNRDAKAEELWNFCLESREIVEKAVGSMKDEDRVTAVVISNGIAYGNDKYVGCQLLRAGGVNAVALAGIQGNTEFNAELIAKWDPDYIITQDRHPNDYIMVTTDPGYAELRAVKDGHVVEAPFWAKPWGNPDADSIALGELWLTRTLYPDKIKKSVLEKRCKDFYKTFYGIDFIGTVE